MDWESYGALREVHYIFRWLGAKFLGPEYAENEAGEAPKLRATEPEPQQALPFANVVSDAPTCSECGGLMTRNGKYLPETYSGRRLPKYPIAIDPPFAAQRMLVQHSHFSP